MTISNNQFQYLQRGNIFKFITINQRANGGHGRLVRQRHRDIATGRNGALQPSSQVQHFARIRQRRFQYVAVGDARNKAARLVMLLADNQLLLLLDDGRLVAVDNRRVMVADVDDDVVLETVRLDRRRHHRLDGQSGRSGRNVLSVGACLGVVLLVLAILDL